MGLPQSVFSVNVASGITLSSGLDLGISWRRIYLEVPTMASGSLYVQAASKLDSTYRRVVHNSSMTDFSINSALSQKVVPVPADGLRFVKVESSSGCTDVITTYKFICGD